MTPSLHGAQTSSSAASPSACSAGRPLSSTSCLPSNRTISPPSRPCFCALICCRSPIYRSCSLRVRTLSLSWFSLSRFTAKFNSAPVSVWYPPPALTTRTNSPLSSYLNTHCPSVYLLSIYTLPPLFFHARSQDRRAMRSSTNRSRVRRRRRRRPLRSLPTPPPPSRSRRPRASTCRCASWCSTVSAGCR